MLSGILSDILLGILSDIFSGILSDVYSDILSGIFSGILLGIYSGILSGILSGGWGPAVPTGLGRSLVEVQQCPLQSGAGGEARRRRRRLRRKARRAILKSNNPQLPGGEQCAFNFEEYSVHSKQTISWLTLHTYNRLLLCEEIIIIYSGNYIIFMHQIYRGKTSPALKPTKCTHWALF